MDGGESRTPPLAATSIQPSNEKPPARPVPPVTRDLPQRRRDDVSGQRAVVAKPIPDAQKVNPRDFQILQVVRRFSPQRQENENGTVLGFKLQPSDPDFPFELDGLRCELTVPLAWPSDGKPRLRVQNAEIPRGYQINIERGFDSLINQARTLLALLNELDKNLESFLTSERAQTVKIVANASRGEASSSLPAETTYSTPTVHPAAPATILSESVYTPQQREYARSKRDPDVRQLEARMNRAPLFSKSADGLSFDVPVQIPRAGRLPVSLHDLKQVTLYVPRLYNLEPCSISLKGVAGGEAHNVEMAFERHSRQEPGLTLMAHINYLTQHIHSMAAESAFQHSSPDLSQATVPIKDVDAAFGIETEHQPANRVFNEERPHIKVIPRPPEWDLPADESDEESSGFEDSDEEFSGSEDDAGGAVLPSTALTAAATGNSIIISFPGIELYGIELLELFSLALTLKCDRCKSTVDVKNLKPSTSDNTALTLTESCPKCAAGLAASFHAEPLHANSIRAGHLDVTSCTIADMLPSTFTPTCSECSTTYPTPPGVISVRGDTTLTVCRSCHRKMTFKIPEVKFIRVAAHASNVPLPPRRRKVKENLGIVTGTPLPNFGRCSHYRKSLRWFRFSCCSKVFACDRCHDEQSEPKHPNEHANRMICGYCSREQNYRPTDCGICRASLVGRRGGGFWEGGKGTRDKAKMSRKDPRKYKRRGGNAPRGA